jgi:phosphotransferase system IIA component
MADFDGNGTFTQIDTVTINGELVADFTHTPAKGTYTVNGDCTGTFTLDFTDGRPPVVTNFVVVNNGFEIDTVVISVAGNEGILALGSVGKRVSWIP